MPILTGIVKNLTHFPLLQNKFNSQLYKHVDGQPAAGNITGLGWYTFVKIPGSKYIKAHCWRNQMIGLLLILMQ